MSRATADSPMRHLPGGTRAFLMRQFRLWHWVSAALSLTGLLMCAATGITLNHPALIPSTPVTTEVGAQLPQDLQRLLQDWPDQTEDPLPDEISRWTRQELALNIAGRATETDSEEIHIPLPRRCNICRIGAQATSRWSRSRCPTAPVCGANIRWPRCRRTDRPS
ncbi:PepSY-associated TM helix domain-containing protein [Paracoccus siganidrum]|uniref:PepSY domain-containing protein n=1 Tax=Paracoccus siganidrum TaxID=1276757 RepID=A0A418ZRG3_9RHOB|nr:PepSY-associated TM helix domain-containing protein [Paracoccus siganidrum]RJK99327.1 hypothetical protein D3P05_23360 [Paracoccus siganidrum]RMC35230.1 hypothetical protein C9E82_11555 [Paracoccus siganidrum]